MLDPIDAETLAERSFGQLSDGIRNVVLQAGDIAKTDIDLARAILFCVLQNFGWCHFSLGAFCQRTLQNSVYPVKPNPADAARHLILAWENLTEKLH